MVIISFWAIKANFYLRRPWRRKKTTSRSVRFFFGGKAAVQTLAFITRKEIIKVKSI
jgi:hypothetical protein